MYRRRDFILAAAKHLPPSAAALHLLDVGGVMVADLQDKRADIQAETASVNVDDWHYTAGSMDAVLAYDTALHADFLDAVRAVMRPGGRLIVVNPVGAVEDGHVQALERAGYTRILVEPAVLGAGVLIRGEKPHVSDDTHARVQVAAAQDADTLDLATYRGRYVHLLVQQTPDKAAWKLEPDEKIHWQAVAAQQNSTQYLLAFSSLPKAVAFMQPAVVQGVVQDVNKVAKFSKATAAGWTRPVLLNPTLEAVQGAKIVLVAVDPESAEASDE
jgi:hypothetical protein